MREWPKKQPEEVGSLGSNSTQLSSAGAHKSATQNQQPQKSAARALTNQQALTVLTFSPLVLTFHAPVEYGRRLIRRPVCKKILDMNQLECSPSWR
eukprot:1141471-Pelagomonas_calceolata.AAC.1